MFRGGDDADHRKVGSSVSLHQCLGKKNLGEKGLNWALVLLCIALHICIACVTRTQEPSDWFAYFWLGI